MKGKRCNRSKKIGNALTKKHIKVILISIINEIIVGECVNGTRK